jgi:hypothetical protein
VKNADYVNLRDIWLRFSNLLNSHALAFQTRKFYYSDSRDSPGQGRDAGQKDYIMTATFGLPSVTSETRDASQKRPISVKCEIRYVTVSVVTITNLKIVEKDGYQALPWVRYITQNGEYQLRMT